MQSTLPVDTAQQVAQLRHPFDWHCQQVGRNKTPVLILDDAWQQPDDLKQFAYQQAFVPDPANFYPGVRSNAPASYSSALVQLLPVLQQVWPATRAMRVLHAAFALTTTAPSALRPIQMLPHIDTAAGHTLALVHYLAGPLQGGTSFYRHRSTALERIEAAQLPTYAMTVKQQAQRLQLHLAPRYQAGDSELFERIAQVPARYNRMVIYPANLLHSGDILQAAAEDSCLSADPAVGRLTLSCLLQLQV